jgi:hypothetical protein
MHAMDLVGINGITRVLLVYTCQQGRGLVLPLRLPDRAEYWRKVLALNSGGPVSILRRATSYPGHVSRGLSSCLQILSRLYIQLQNTSHSKQAILHTHTSSLSQFRVEVSNCYTFYRNTLFTGPLFMKTIDSLLHKGQQNT